MDREKAISVIRNNWPEGRQMLKEALETLIPELKETEDDKMAKSITDFIKRNGGGYPQELKDKWINWIETKQNNNVTYWSEEDETGMNDAMWCIGKIAEGAASENDMGACWSAEKWIKNIKDRMIWKPSKSHLDGLKETIDTLKNNLNMCDGRLEWLYDDLNKLQ